MSNHWSEFLTVAAVHLFAVMSPGPDFVMISRNSLIYSRRAGVYSALGLAMGILVHVTYSLVGIGLLISKSLVLFNVLKWAGAAYLIYVGIASLRAKAPASNDANVLKKERLDLSGAEAVRMGFITNVLNPKATLFFFALFTQVIHPQTPKMIQAYYGLEMSLMTFAWFALVAVILSQPVIRQKMTQIQHRLEQVFGAILLALGLKVAFSVK